jgi:hypothetical protein
MSKHTLLTKKKNRAQGASKAEELTPSVHSKKTEGRTEEIEIVPERLQVRAHLAIE